MATEKRSRLARSIQRMGKKEKFFSSAATFCDAFFLLLPPPFPTGKPLLPPFFLLLPGALSTLQKRVFENFFFSPSSPNSAQELRFWVFSYVRIPYLQGKERKENQGKD